jgi:hypothetical protein
MARLMKEELNGNVRQCDANCYDSRKTTKAQCTCVCGGINHGVGLSKAVENSVALEGDRYWRNRYKGVKFCDLQMVLSL